MATFNVRSVLRAGWTLTGDSARLGSLKQQQEQHLSASALHHIAGVSLSLSLFEFMVDGARREIIPLNYIRMLIVCCDFYCCYSIVLYCVTGTRW